MGLQDRDYLRRGRRPPTFLETARVYLSDWRGMLTAATAVIAVASTGLWLYRDARNVAEDFGPAEGALRVNINTATQDELESVPDIGPAKAAAIIANRPYATVDDLVRLDGISPSQVEGFRPFVKTVGETATQ